MPPLILIIPTAAVVMRLVFPERPHHADIVPLMDLARLKIERALRMERPMNVRISVDVVSLDPVTWHCSPARLVPPMDFNFEVVPHVNITIIWMPELPELFASLIDGVIFGSLNDIFRMKDKAQRYNVLGMWSSQQPWGIIGVKADVVVVIRIRVV
ncbi:MAG: hypothetical protein EYC68_09705 [Chloroflexota bacterium]|nr:MAG: hypothetical protein EYC68_09705 [Chloroflexota bacterium]